ncbi:MAG: hypothetical protein NC122_02105 [Faecalibacterium sp.]|nr:hypothetical protein [Ruminococcus sp.]MCM1391949.1 hypothetical protein [Ruminococcus sp.]MCM1484977.1 hypothetical protein [Faecalibacterium sp.]
MKTIKTIISLALVSMLILACISPALALAPESERLYDGIDVSVFQGDIDFERVRESGIRVVYIRAGYGNGLRDEFFERNAERARLAGLRFGFYFYVTARSRYEAELQGRYFASIIRGKDYDCRPVMDFEDFSGLSHTEIREIGLAFMRALEDRTRILPMIYTDAYAASFVWGEDFARYPLWVADYGPTEPDVIGDVWNSWVGFQYSDVGRIDGIEDDVDLDKFTSRAFLTEDEKDASHCRER